MSAQLTYVGTATVILRLDARTVVTDPVLDPAGSRYRIGPFAYENLQGPSASVPTEPDVVLLSHDHHRDNFDRAGLALARRARTVVTTQSGAARLRAKGLRHVVGLVPWQRCELDGLCVTATPARHGPLGTNAFAGDVVGFHLEHPALRAGPLYITGDTRWFAGLARVRERLPRPATILAHVGAARFGPPLLRRWLQFSMDAEELRTLDRVFQPRQLFPIHDGGWSHFSEGRDAILRAFAGDSARLRLLARGETTALEP